MRGLGLLFCGFAIAIALAFAASSATAQAQLSADLREKIDKLAADALTKTGVPSASVAIVQDGQITYVKAYGDARIEPRTPATPEMRYSIGSISKQFTATAILLLQHGKIDRSLFTDNANSYFSEQALKDFASSLGPLGDPQGFTQVFQALRGGMTLRVYRIQFANKALRAWTYEIPDGKLEQYQVAAQE